MAETLDWYNTWRVSLGFDQIEFSVGGIDLFAPEEMLEGQTGYAVAEDGGSLVTGETGAWQSDWLAIGHETSFGDVLIVSRTSPHPVFSAMHGQGSWEPGLIAQDLESFRTCLEAFRRYAEGRSCPAEMEENPPSAEEKAAFLRSIDAATSSHPGALNFWILTAEAQNEAL